MSTGNCFIDRIHPGFGFPRAAICATFRLHCGDGHAGPHELVGAPRDRARASHARRGDGLLREQPVESSSQIAPGNLSLVGKRDPRNLVSRPSLYELLSEIGFIRVYAAYNDFVFAPLTRPLIWLLRNLSILLENAPVVRTMAGSILLHAQKPPRKKQLREDLAVRP